MINLSKIEMQELYGKYKNILINEHVDNSPDTICLNSGRVICGVITDNNNLIIHSVSDLILG